MKKIGLNEAIPEDAKLIQYQESAIHVYFADDPEVVSNENGMRIIAEQQFRQQYKRNRHELMLRVKITTKAGNTFDAGEKSRQRIASTILIMDDTEEMQWTLADNTTLSASKAELTEALRLIVLAHNEMWYIK